MESPPTDNFYHYKLWLIKFSVVIRVDGIMCIDQLLEFSTLRSHLWSFRSCITSLFVRCATHTPKHDCFRFASSKYHPQLPISCENISDIAFFFSSNNYFMCSPGIFSRLQAPENVQTSKSDKFREHTKNLLMDIPPTILTSLEQLRLQRNQHQT